MPVNNRSHLGAIVMVNLELNPMVRTGNISHRHAQYTSCQI